MSNLDGRKLRWIDCRWNNTGFYHFPCRVCRVCKYLEFLEEAKSVAPAGSHVERNQELDAYLKLNKREKKQAIHQLSITNSTK